MNTSRQLPPPPYILGVNARIFSLKESCAAFIKNQAAASVNKRFKSQIIGETETICKI